MTQMLEKTHVLLLRPDKAGDAIKSLPAIRLARQKRPDIRFSILCSQNNSSVFAYEPGIISFTLPNDWESFPPDELHTTIQKLPFQLPIQLVINLLSDDFTNVELLLDLIPAKEKWSRARNMGIEDRSMQGTAEEWNIAHILGTALHTGLALSPVDLANTTALNRKPVLGHLDRQEARTELSFSTKTRLAFCPFAGTSQRSHSLRRWKFFLNMAARFAAPTDIFLFGAKGDQQALEYLKSRCSNVHIIYPSSFRALGAYLELMSGVVAIDSGPLHLGRSLGIPSLGILSGGDFKRWFSELTPHDRLVPRGFLFRYPGLFQMYLAFKRWCFANRFIPYQRTV